jgi:F-type H+-transporting ATPase subunit delta
MQPKLEGYAIARLGLSDAQTLAATASELAALDRAILSQVELRGVLTDTALSPVVRAGVVRTLLEGKVSNDTLQLAVYAASHAAAQDLPHAISELAIAALVQSERGAMDVALLGLLAARLRATGMVDAAIEHVATSDFARIEEELFHWARVIEGNLDLRRVLVDRDANVASRLGLVTSLLGGKVHEATLRLAEYIIIVGRARDIVGTLDYLVDYVAKARDWRVARVHTARELDEASESQLVAALSTLTGKNVELQVAADATLLGGVVIEVGDLRLDASTKGRLGALHDAVMSGRVLESALND